MRCFLDELVEHLVGDVFNHVGGQLVDEPGEHLFLVSQIAMVETGDFVLKVDESREVINAIFLGHMIVVDLDEGNPLGVAFVVDVLQLGQDPLRLFIVVVICNPSARPFVMRKESAGPVIKRAEIWNKNKIDVVNLCVIKMAANVGWIAREQEETGDSRWNAAQLSKQG